MHPLWNSYPFLTTAEEWTRASSQSSRNGEVEEELYRCLLRQLIHALDPHYVPSISISKVCVLRKEGEAGQRALIRPYRRKILLEDPCIEASRRSQPSFAMSQLYLVILQKSRV